MASTVAASARITASSTMYAAATHISTGSRKVISKGAIRARAFQMGRAHSSKGEFSCRAAADAVMDADEPPGAGHMSVYQDAHAQGYVHATNSGSAL
eukprot:1189727-Prorocentrum_minimum.AAC.4